jgi:hypothetical protein
MPERRPNSEQRSSEQRIDPPEKNPGKNQGEGDYEAAERFNESERQFVNRHGTPRQPVPEPEEERELRRAEKKGLARSHGREHDAVDEQLFREGIAANDKKKKN